MGGSIVSDVEPNGSEKGPFGLVAYFVPLREVHSVACRKYEFLGSIHVSLHQLSATTRMRIDGLQWRQ